MAVRLTKTKDVKVVRKRALSQKGIGMKTDEKKYTPARNQGKEE